jgi:hypothetical protein
MLAQMAHLSRISCQTQAGELPACLRREEIPVGAARVTVRRRARSSPVPAALPSELRQLLEPLVQAIQKEQGGGTS